MAFRIAVNFAVRVEIGRRSGRIRIILAPTTKGDRMKPTSPKPGKGAPASTVFAPPTPKVSRQQRGKVLTAAEKAAFLASRPDLKPKD
ncbi:MAG: hypothetical protein JWP92_429 [Caulobacter sp.]|nr:hypothetical protein [Caulobacter sp.]